MVIDKYINLAVLFPPTPHVYVYLIAIDCKCVISLVKFNQTLVKFSHCFQHFNVAKMAVFDNFNIGTIYQSPVFAT